MAVTVTHATQSATPDSGDGKISSNAWNESHSISGLGTAAEADTTDFAATVHTHTIANVTGLQAALDGKQPAGSYLTSITGSDVTTALGYTPTSVTGLTGTQSVAAFKTGLSLVKGDVGLGNVDNTSDLSKPVSTATQAALDLKADTSSLDGKLSIYDGAAFSGWDGADATDNDVGLIVNAPTTGSMAVVYTGESCGAFYAQNSDATVWMQFGGALNGASRIPIGASHNLTFGSQIYVGPDVVYNAGNLSSATVVSKIAAQAIAPASVAATGAVTSSGGGIGYATGSGGTATQATSKATAVTLNKLTGEITMNTAALAAGAIVTFTLNNSFIAANDMIVVSHHSGGTIGPYLLNGRATGAGTASIAVRNTSAGSLGEAIVLKFAIIKAVAA